MVFILEQVCFQFEVGIGARKQQGLQLVHVFDADLVLQASETHEYPRVKIAMAIGIGPLVSKQDIVIPLIRRAAD